MFNGLKNPIGLINTWLSIGTLQDIQANNFIKRITKMFTIEDLYLATSFVLNKFYFIL